MPGHHIPLHQGSDGADVPQSLVKRQQFRGEVEWSQASDGAAQPPLLFTGQRRDCATKQSVRLHGGAEERVGVLEKRKRKTNETFYGNYQEYIRNVPPLHVMVFLIIKGNGCFIL